MLYRMTWLNATLILQDLRIKKTLFSTSVVYPSMESSDVASLLNTANIGAGYNSLSKWLNIF